MRRHLAVLLLSTALVATACDAEEGAGETPGPTGPDRVTVGVIPIVDVAPIYLGVEKGFFAKRNLSLTLKQEAGGADIVPAVNRQEYEFGFSNVVSLLLAQSEGMPLKMVSNGVNSTGVDSEDFASLMVRGNSPIQSAADLEGRTVAANAAPNIVDTVVRDSVRRDGGDPTKVKFVEMPFPEQPAALQRGQIDAAFVVEPFQQQVLADGGRKIASSYVDAAPDMTVAAYFTGLQQKVDNPDMVERFSAAMKESLAYADSHPEETRKIIATYTDLNPDVIEKLTLPKWPSEINRQSMQTLADLALEDGVLKRAAFVDNLFP
jgi:NitT/TauT family transport system substrate-binding protein